MNRVFRPIRRRAVTLLEVILAMSILVVLSGTTFWFYSSTLESREKSTAEAERLRLVRALLDRMSEEIRQASAITADGRVGIRGTADRIWLSTLRLPDRNLARQRFVREEWPAGQYDLVKTEYKIARHPEILHEDGYEMPLGLARVEILIPRPDSAQLGAGLERDRREFGGGEGGVEQALAEEQFLEGVIGGDPAAEPTTAEDINWQELYSSDIRFLRFCYFDGSRWWDSWDVTGENPLPQMVQFTVGFNPERPFEDEFSDPAIVEYCTCMNEDPMDCLPEPPDRFTRTVRVRQADPLFRSRIGREAQDAVENIPQEGDGGEEQQP